MRNRKYLIGALVGVLGVFAFSGVASARPISQSLETTLAPKKQDKKVFGGVSLRNNILTTIDNPALTQSPKLTVFTIDRNVRFVNGNIPACPLSAIEGKFTDAAKMACPHSITGGGSVEVNGGAIGGTVTFFSGGPKTIYVQTDIGPGATSLTIIGTIFHRSLSFSNIPNTPGLVLTDFDTTFNKRKTGKMKVKVNGKKKKVPTYYVMARCKAKAWTTTEVTTFYSGEVLRATSTEKCHKKGSKKKK
ncbi:MAG: hypothetical protein WBV53_16145 [Solirubrobacterales bacterium]